jgi:thymidylate kinase
MIVILEGNDRAGKTTIADALVSEDGFRKVHFGPPETNDFGLEFILRLTEELLTEIDADHPRDLVFDRAHLGELVYGPLDRGVTRMTSDQMSRIENLLLHAGAVLVWVDTPPYICHERAMDTIDQADLSRFEEIHEGYDRAFEESSLPKIRLTDVNSLRTIIKWFQT